MNSWSWSRKPKLRRFATCHGLLEREQAAYTVSQKQIRGFSMKTLTRMDFSAKLGYLKTLPVKESCVVSQRPWNVIEKIRSV